MSLIKKTQNYDLGKGVGSLLGEVLVCFIGGWLLVYATERRWFDVPHAAATIYVLRRIFQ